MYVSDTLSIRRHAKYITREIAEKVIGNQKKRIRNSVDEFIDNKINLLIEKLRSGGSINQEDLTIDLRDLMEFLVRNEIVFQVGVKVTGSEIGKDLSRIISKPSRIPRYVIKYRRILEEVNIL
jgi:hypothetical protein